YSFLQSCFVRSRRLALPDPATKPYRLTRHRLSDRVSATTDYFKYLRVAQFQPVKRLLQHWNTLVAVWQAVLVIAGRKDEGHAARGARVGDGVAHLPVEIDIEHRSVNGLRVEHRQSLIDAGGGADDRAA